MTKEMMNNRETRPQRPRLVSSLFFLILFQALIGSVIHRHGEVMLGLTVPSAILDSLGTNFNTVVQAQQQQQQQQQQQRKLATFTTEQKDEEEESFSTCLLIMDENFRLREWLAYHYHVLQLRYVVVAQDAKSKLDPKPIFEMFQRELPGLKIVVWSDADFIDWNSLPEFYPEDNPVRFIIRQRIFLSKCMTHMKDNGKTWTALFDVDEYIAFKGYDKQRSIMSSIDNTTSTIISSPPDLTEPGSILKHMKQANMSGCISMIRTAVGVKEDAKSAAVHQQQNHTLGLNPLRLDTLRYQYHSAFDAANNGIGKTMLNVQYISADDSLDVRSPHRPVPRLCPPSFFEFTQHTPFFLLHYVGAWNAFSFRVDSRNSRKHTRWLKRSKYSQEYEPTTVTWLQGFAKDVGREKAVRLLQFTGLPSSNASSANYNEQMAAEGLQF